MKKAEAIEIVKKYQKKWGLEGPIDERACEKYDQFERLEGVGWAIVMTLPPSNFEGFDTVTFVVSINDKKVEYIVNSMGYIKYPHDEEDDFFSDEDLDELGFEEI